MGRETGIPGGKNPDCPKRRGGTEGGKELWEVEGTHSSLGKNPPTTASLAGVEHNDGGSNQEVVW